MAIFPFVWKNFNILLTILMQSDQILVLIGSKNIILSLLIYRQNLHLVRDI